MEYQIEVKELLIEDNKLTLNIMGTITDSVINAHFVSKPKVILHFINKREDRRIPFVLSNVIHTDGKCYFSGRSFGFAVLENRKGLSAVRYVSQFQLRRFL